MVICQVGSKGKKTMGVFLLLHFSVRIYSATVKDNFNPFAALERALKVLYQRQRFIIRATPTTEILAFF